MAKKNDEVLEEITIDELEIDDEEVVEQELQIAPVVYYTKNEDMMNEIRLSHEREVYNQEHGIDASPLTPRLCQMFYDIADKLSKSRKVHYKYEEDREDCVSFAVMDCVNYWRSFNRELLPLPDENGMLQYDSEGNCIMYKAEYNMELVPDVVAVKIVDFNPNTMVVLNAIGKKKYRVVKIGPDGKVKKKKPNPFSYFTSVCASALTKGWLALGYGEKDGLPFSKRVYITDSIFSL